MCRSLLPTPPPPSHSHPSALGASALAGQTAARCSRRHAPAARDANRLLVCFFSRCPRRRKRAHGAAERTPPPLRHILPRVSNAVFVHRHCPFQQVLDRIDASQNQLQVHFSPAISINMLPSAPASLPACLPSSSASHGCQWALSSEDRRSTTLRLMSAAAAVGDVAAAGACIQARPCWLPFLPASNIVSPSPSPLPLLSSSSSFCSHCA